MISLKNAGEITKSHKQVLNSKIKASWEIGNLQSAGAREIRLQKKKDEGEGDLELQTITPAQKIVV
jgi:hypothetical protein